MRKHKLNKIIIISIAIIMALGLFIEYTFYKPTQLNFFVASKIFKSPDKYGFENSDDYKNAVDLYNDMNNSNLPYTTNWTDEQAEVIASLDSSNPNQSVFHDLMFSTTVNGGLYNILACNIAGGCSAESQYIRTTFADAGYSVIFQIDNSNEYTLVNYPGGSISMTPSGAALDLYISYDEKESNDKHIVMSYIIVGKSSGSHTYKLATTSDIMIGGNDSAPVRKINLNNEGFIIYQISLDSSILNNPQLGLLMSQPATTTFIGKYSERNTYKYINYGQEAISGIDSGFAFSWQGTINGTEAHEYTLTFDVYKDFTSDDIEAQNIYLFSGEKEEIVFDDPTVKDYLHLFSFESSNPSIATVDEEGNVIGVSEGETVITVRSKYDSNIYNSFPVTIKDRIDIEDDGLNSCIIDQYNEKYGMEYESVAELSYLQILEFGNDELDCSEYDIKSLTGLEMLYYLNKLVLSKDNGEQLTIDDNPNLNEIYIYVDRYAYEGDDYHSSDRDYSFDITGTIGFDVPWLEPDGTYEEDSLIIRNEVDGEGIIDFLASGTYKISTYYGYQKIVGSVAVTEFNNFHVFKLESVDDDYVIDNNRIYIYDSIDNLIDNVYLVLGDDRYQGDDVQLEIVGNNIPNSILIIKHGDQYIKQFAIIPKVKTISADDVEIYKGATANINAQISPANATNGELTYSSADTSIATVNENGRIIGVEVGTTEITIKTVDETVSKTITVTVNGRLTLKNNSSLSFVENNDNKYFVSNSIVVMTKTQFINQFQYFDGNIYYNNGTTEVGMNEPIGTGMIIKSNNTTYYISMRGDIPNNDQNMGDGNAGVLDYINVRKHIMGEATISNSIRFLSADVNNDGAIGVLDYIAIRKYIMNKNH